MSSLATATAAATLRALSLEGAVFVAVVRTVLDKNLWVSPVRVATGSFDPAVENFATPTSRFFDLPGSVRDWSVDGTPLGPVRLSALTSLNRFGLQPTVLVRILRFEEPQNPLESGSMFVYAELVEPSNLAAGTSHFVVNAIDGLMPSAAAGLFELARPSLQIIDGCVVASHALSVLAGVPVHLSLRDVAHLAPFIAGFHPSDAIDGDLSIPDDYRFEASGMPMWSALQSSVDPSKQDIVTAWVEMLASPLPCGLIGWARVVAPYFDKQARTLIEDLSLGHRLPFAEETLRNKSPEHFVQVRLLELPSRLSSRTRALTRSFGYTFDLPLDLDFRGAWKLDFEFCTALVAASPAGSRSRLQANLRRLEAMGAFEHTSVEWQAMHAAFDRDVDIVLSLTDASTVLQSSVQPATPVLDTEMS
jgi:hypothetical protein